MIFWQKITTHWKHIFFSSQNQKKNQPWKINPIQLFFDRELYVAQGLSFCYALSKITWKKHKDFDNYLFDTKKNYVNQRKKSPQVPKKQ